MGISMGLMMVHHGNAVVNSGNMEVSNDWDTSNRRLMGLMMVNDG